MAICLWATQRRAALRREQCDVITRSIARRQLGKDVSVATDMHVTVEELLGAVFSTQSVPTLYSEHK
jgi:hypothetical protein